MYEDTPDKRNMSFSIFENKIKILNFMFEGLIANDRSFYLNCPLDKSKKINIFLPSVYLI